MMKKKRQSGRGKRKASGEVWKLRLYVTGNTSRSMTAIRNLKRLCNEHLRGRYKVEVVDLLKHPQMAAGDQIIAVPTLVRRLPPLLKRIIGDLSNTQQVLVLLELCPEKVSS